MGKGLEQAFSQRRHINGQQVHEKVLNITNHQGYASQTNNEISPHMSVIKKTSDNNCW